MKIRTTLHIFSARLSQNSSKNIRLSQYVKERFSEWKCKRVCNFPSAEFFEAKPQRTNCAIPYLIYESEGRRRGRGLGIWVGVGTLADGVHIVFADGDGAARAADAGADAVECAVALGGGH